MQFSRNIAKAHLLPVSICTSSRGLTHNRRACLSLVGVRHSADSVHAKLGVSQAYAEQTGAQAAICAPLPLQKLASDDTRVAHRRLVDSKCEVPDVIRNDELPVNIRWLGAIRQHSLQSFRCVHESAKARETDRNEQKKGCKSLHCPHRRELQWCMCAARSPVRLTSNRNVSPSYDINRLRSCRGPYATKRAFRWCRENEE